MSASRLKKNPHPAPDKRNDPKCVQRQQGPISQDGRHVIPAVDLIKHRQRENTPFAMAPLPPREVQPPYVPVIFSNTDAIIEMHKGLPRMGHTNNILALVNGTSEEGREYITGVILIPTLIFLLFFIWSTLILSSMYCCSKQAGFLSGKPPFKPLPPSGYNPREKEGTLSNHSTKYPEEQSNINLGSENDIVTEREQPSTVESTDVHESIILAKNIPSEQLDSDQDRETQNTVQREVDKYERDITRREHLLLKTRIVALVAGAGIIISSITFVAQGINGLGTALKTGGAGFYKAQRIIDEGVSLCNEFIAQQETILHEVNESFSETQKFGFCPNLREQFIQECLNGTIGNSTDTFLGLDNNVTGNDACDTIIGFPVQVSLNKVNRILRTNILALNNEIKSLHDDLVELSDVTETWQRYFQSFRWAFWVCVGFAIILDLIVLFLLFGVVLAWQQKLSAPFKCARSKVIVPLFILVTFLVWLFATIACVGGVMGADSCFDAPDDKILTILKKNRERFSSIVVGLAEYYLSRCDKNKSPKIAIANDTGTDNVRQVILAVHDLISQTQEIDEVTFMKTCGANITPVLSIANFLDEQFHSVYHTLDNTTKLLWCYRVDPVYVTVVYNGVCYDGVTGLFQMFISLFLIVCCSLVMITFRAAWQDECIVDVPNDLFLWEITDEPCLPNQQNAIIVSPPLTVMSDYQRSDPPHDSLSFIEAGKSVLPQTSEMSDSNLPPVDSSSYG